MENQRMLKKTLEARKQHELIRIAIIG